MEKQLMYVHDTNAKMCTHPIHRTFFTAMSVIKKTTISKWLYTVDWTDY